VVLLAQEILAGARCRDAKIGAPAFAGVLVALLILLPESVAGSRPRARTTCRRASIWRSLLARDHRADHPRRGPAYTLDKQLVSPQRPGDGAPAVDVMLSMLTFAPAVPTSCSASCMWWCLPSTCSWYLCLIGEDKMLSAKSDVQVDTPEVRVTEWRLARQRHAITPTR